MGGEREGGGVGVGDGGAGMGWEESVVGVGGIAVEEGGGPVC